MKATGIVRRIDDLGRVVIPKEIRRTMRIREGDPLEICLLYTSPAAVARAIDAIGTVTKDSGDAIQSARAAYDQLTDAQKSLIDQATRCV